MDFSAEFVVDVAAVVVVIDFLVCDSEVIAEYQ
jgi:hypothetical protein